MEYNVFKLTKEQLMEIARSLQTKIETGLKEYNTEIKGLPTYIHPKLDVKGTKVLVLDFGGTNLRAAVVEFINGKPVVSTEEIAEKRLPEKIKEPGYDRDLLFDSILNLVKELNLNGVTSIGYCFSYPANNQVNGDAVLTEWTKGIKIERMIGELVGGPLKEYLEEKLKIKIKGIKVINDTVASLFAGLVAEGSYDAYIGLIVGTGTNMALSVFPEQITKLDKEYKGKEWITVNLESGNFNPPHLTLYDEKVDKESDNQGRQRFEKAISGMYLGKILEAVFPDKQFEKGFDARNLNNMINYPDIYKEEYVKVARWIYQRSAHLVAASLAGSTLTLLKQNPDLKKICLMAEGSLFWSTVRNDNSFKELVSGTLDDLLAALGYKDICVNIIKVDNANLIGSAIAGVSI